MQDLPKQNSEISIPHAIFTQDFDEEDEEDFNIGNLSSLDGSLNIEPSSTVMCKSKVQVANCKAYTTMKSINMTMSKASFASDLTNRERILPSNMFMLLDVNQMSVKERLKRSVQSSSFS